MVKPWTVCRTMKELFLNKIEERKSKEHVKIWLHYKIKLKQQILKMCVPLLCNIVSVRSFGDILIVVLIVCSFVWRHCVCVPPISQVKISSKIKTTPNLLPPCSRIPLKKRLCCTFPFAAFLPLPVFSMQQSGCLYGWWNIILTIDY